MTRCQTLLAAACVLSLAPIARAAEAPQPANPAIDMQGYLRVADDAAAHREQRRLSEEDFIRLSREPGTLILDARSKQKYDELHIKGAINLPFPDIAVERLHEAIPDKNTRILIYCNNNFRGAEEAFPVKMQTAALNISTYIALYNYGYRNVYELAPLLDVKSSKLEFESSTAEDGTRPDPK
jgi:hypothetical protein